MINTQRHNGYKDRKPIRLTYFLLLPVLLMALNGCYYDVEEELYPVGSNPCDTSNVTYSATIQPMLQQNCYSCHSDAAYLGSITVEGYDNVITLVNNGKLVGSVNYQSGYAPMPSDAPKLSDCNLLKIDTWIKHGALNN
ncbi:MAG: hypothetical protein IPO83_09005 [Chitinophagaceae bacterium]|nr:hypothetical protein [Chitinophagaceae bacterium]